jgi:hypothetical protein
MLPHRQRKGKNKRNQHSQVVENLNYSDESLKHGQSFHHETVKSFEHLDGVFVNLSDSKQISARFEFREVARERLSFHFAFK